MTTKPLLLLPLFFSAQSFAEKSIYDLTLKELMQVKVVTAASGFEQSLKQAAASATVIAHEEWESMGAYTLADVLEQVAGVHVTEPQVNFNHNLYAIRAMGGQFGEQVKILVDGHSIEYAKDGGPYIGFDMPVDSFKRIEVVRGPGSAIYGADAFAGVINLVSYGVDEVPAQVTLRSGAFDTQTLSFSGHKSSAANHFSLSFDYMKSNNDTSRVIHQDLQTTLDQVFGTHASHAPGRIDEHFNVYNLMAKWRYKAFSLRYHSWQNKDFGVGSGIAQALDPDGSGSSQHDTLSAAYDLSNLVNSGQLTLAADLVYSRVLSYLHVFPAGSIIPIGSDGNADFVTPQILASFPQGYVGTPSSKNFNRRLTLTQLFDLEHHKIRWQAGYEYIDFKPLERKNFGPGILNGTQSEVSGDLTDVSNTPWAYVSKSIRRYYYLSFLDEWQYDDHWLFNLGARFDHYSDFGDTFNPRVNLLYRANDAWTIKFFSGTAFRAPSIGELYYRNNPVSLGNPNLAPEGVNTIEVGFGLDLLAYDNLWVTLNLFDYSADNLIRYVYTAERNGNMAQNVGSEKGHGAELELRWKPSREVTFDFNYSVATATDDEHNPIPDQPREMYKGSLFWQLDNHWQWSCNARWIKDRRRKVTDSRPQIADYVIFNSRLAYNDLMPGLNLSLSVDNLFGRQAREPSNGQIPEDYPLPGRQWMVQLQQRF